jgi:hypothetical protein
MNTNTDTNTDKSKSIDKTVAKIKNLSNALKVVYDYIRDNAARKIQKGCYNWLYSPKCKDGTVGIVPRLGWKKYKIIQM